MIRSGWDRQRRFRPTIRILFQHVRDSEDCNSRDASKRVREDETQGIRKVRWLAFPLFTNIVIQQLQAYTRNRTDNQEVDERVARRVRQGEGLWPQAGDPANTRYSHCTSIAPR